MQGKSWLSLTVVTAALLATAGCSGGSATNQGSVDKSIGLQDSQLNITDLTSKHDHVGAFGGTTLTGQKLTVTPGDGKILVVNFWGSWCAPCNAEEQAFVQVAKDDAGKGVTFVGVAEKEDGTAGALAFEKKFGVPYQSLDDKSGSIELDFPTAAVPSTTPTTLVIGRNGDVLAKVSGPMEYTDLNPLVAHFLAQQT